MDKGLIDRLFARALNAGVQAWRIVGGELNDFVSVLNCITLGGWRTPRLANERGKMIVWKSVFRENMAISGVGET